MPTDFGDPDSAPHSAQPEPGTDPLTKTCPFCAELVLAAAIKCKHCGSNLQAPPAPLGSVQAPAPQPAVAASSSALKIGTVFFVLSCVHLASLAAAGWFAVATLGSKPFVPAWNTALCIGLIALIMGIKQRSRWAYEWVVGTSAINTISNAINLFGVHDPGDHPVVLTWFFSGALVNGIAWYCLRRTREEFSTPLPAEDALLQPSNRASIYITIALIAGALVVSALQQP